MKTRIVNVVIIDESGFMQSIKKEAIDNVNKTIQAVRSVPRKHKEQDAI